MKTDAANIVSYKTASGELFQTKVEPRWSATTAVEKEARWMEDWLEFTGFWCLAMQLRRRSRRWTATGMRKALIQFKAKFPRDAERTTELYEHIGEPARPVASEERVGPVDRRASSPRRPELQRS